MCFVSSNWKTFLQDWQEPLTALSWRLITAVSATKVRSPHADVFWRRWHHEVRKTEQLLQTCITCDDAVMATRLGPSALRLPHDFLFSTTNVSETLLVSFGNIGWSMARGIVVFWMLTEILSLRRLRRLAYVLRIHAHYLSPRVLFCTLWTRLVKKTAVVLSLFTTLPFFVHLP